MELCITNNNMKICIFIQIFDAILTENIQFPMCRSQPLLLYQSLIQSNKFINKCKDFLINYNIQWNPQIIFNSYSNKYKAKQVNETLKKHLFQIKHLLEHSVKKQSNKNIDCSNSPQIMNNNNNNNNANNNNNNNNNANNNNNNNNNNN
eukprot:225119_1